MERFVPKGGKPDAGYNRHTEQQQQRLNPEGDSGKMSELFLLGSV